MKILVFLEELIVDPVDKILAQYNQKWLCNATRMENIRCSSTIGQWEVDLDDG
jgi:hypothetical protein